MDSLEQKVSSIEARNQTVEADKAWETSWTRRVLLSLFTYLALSTYLWAIDVQRPWLSAIVPTTGFLISTLSMPYFKKRWLDARRESVLHKN